MDRFFTDIHPIGSSVHALGLCHDVVTYGGITSCFNRHDDFEDREEYKVKSLKDASYKIYLILILLPVGLMAFAAPLRSILMAGFSFYPPALLKFNEPHQYFYDYFIPIFGDLFPYWLDFYWGIYGVIVIFIIGILDSMRRNLLVRQIEILPTSKIHAAAIGLVELKGKAIPVLNNKTDPIMRSWVEDTGDGYAFRSIANPFYIDDGTGRVLVDPKDCQIEAEEKAFEVKLHHAVLKNYKSNKNFPECRLMPNDEVYVLGNLQINHDATDKQDQVIIKPQKSSLLRINFYDLFFVSNISEEALLEKFKKSVNRGWMGVFIAMVITGWMSIYAWNNISQLKTFELDAAPSFFRMISTPTILERKYEVEGLGVRPTMHWLDMLKQGHESINDIMSALKDQHLTWLAIPILLKHAEDIDHLNFGMANFWIQKLGATPDGHLGVQYWKHKSIDEYVNGNQTFIYNVLLKYQEPKLFVTYRAHFGKVNSERLELLKRYVVFTFTNKETGVVKEMQLFSEEGWNKVNNKLLFEHFLPGKYEFSNYASRHYRGGRSDRGSRARKALDISF